MESGWHVIGASVLGSAHQKAGYPCQDAQAFEIYPDGTVLIAVADGAGTASKAEEGSRAAVTAALHFFCAAIAFGWPEDASGWDRLIRSGFCQARQALLDLAAQESLPAREFATTLTCVVLTAGWLSAGQVGDGAVVVETDQGDLRLVTRPQRGEYANETSFLTQEDALDRLELYADQHPVRSLAVMSDGLIRLGLKVPAYEPHPPFFEPLWTFTAQSSDETAAAEQLVAFLESERVCARTDDDKTLVLAVRVPAGSSGGE